MTAGLFKSSTHAGIKHQQQLQEQRVRSIKRCSTLVKVNVVPFVSHSKKKNKKKKTHFLGGKGCLEILISIFCCVIAVLMLQTKTGNTDEAVTRPTRASAPQVSPISFSLDFQSAFLYSSPLRRCPLEAAQTAELRLSSCLPSCHKSDVSV